MASEALIIASAAMFAIRSAVPRMFASYPESKVEELPEYEP